MPEPNESTKVDQKLYFYRQIRNILMENGLLALPLLQDQLGLQKAQVLTLLNAMEVQQQILVKRHRGNMFIELNPNWKEKGR